MNKHLYTGFIACMLLLTTACSPLERQAYNTVVAAKAFLDKEKSAHPECTPGATGSFCQFLTKATSAKDSIVDAAEVYCSGKDFESGGNCNPPAKGTPAADQAAAKLRAAIAIYNQAAKDLKGAI